jgi:hypothetical protein
VLQGYEKLFRRWVQYLKKMIFFIFSAHEKIAQLKVIKLLAMFLLLANFVLHEMMNLAHT